MIAERSLTTINASILAIDREADARRFLREYISSLEADGEPHEIAVEVARSAVAWCFAAGMTRQRCAMWQRVIGLERADHALRDAAAAGSAR